MSVSASIDLRIVYAGSGTAVSPMKILAILTSHEWNLKRDGKVFYLLNDDSDWESEAMSIESLMKIFEQKEVKDEQIGATATWQDTYIGGEVLLWTKKQIAEDSFHINMSFLLTSDRKILADYGDFKITDVNWYLERLLPIFNQGDTYVEYYSYSEHR